MSKAPHRDEESICRSGVESEAVDSKRSTVNGVLNTDPTARAGQCRPKRSWSRSTLAILVDNWFLGLLAIAILVASQIQIPQAHQHVKQVVVTYLAVSIIFFITGCTLETQTLLRNYSKWKTHIFVQALCFIMPSLIVFGLVSAIATNKHFMDPGLLVGLIFFSSIPTTISSNVIMTRQAHGNEALTVVQTTVGNFLGVFITPALVVGYTSVNAWYKNVLPPSSGHFGEIYARVLKQLGLSIYIPLFVGQLVRYTFPDACRKLFITWKLNKLGSICLLLIIWQTYDGAFASHSFDTVPASNKIFIVFISVALWLSFFGIAFTTSLVWLPRKDVVAVCYCVPAKGPAMGVPLATTIFAGLDPVLESKIQIPIVIYQGLQLAFGSIMVGIFRRWVNAEQDAPDSQVEGAPPVTHIVESSEKE